MFNKQDIAEKFTKFFSTSPPPIYETEPETINIEHPDL